MNRDECACGHLLADHERTYHDHSWVCWAAMPEGSEPCRCAGCQETPGEARCQCRRFRAVASGPQQVPVVAEASADE